ncbi:hypothetical protein SESBI_33890 [Sesbania bispinosa]|nr:hypothetical protein SESBI_33890 [Sesbania bispinosa]
MAGVDVKTLEKGPELVEDFGVVLARLVAEELSGTGRRVAGARQPRWTGRGRRGEHNVAAGQSKKVIGDSPPEKNQTLPEKYGCRRTSLVAGEKPVTVLGFLGL